MMVGGSWKSVAKDHERTDDWWLGGVCVSRIIILSVSQRVFTSV